MIPAAIGLTLAVGLGDYATGIEITFTLLYLFPVALATWARGRAAGFVIAALAAACTMVIAILDGGRAARPLPLVWNTSGSLAVFAAVAWLIDGVHELVRRERAERAAAVEQLRHAERLNVIGTLAAGVAHELGTPLNVIVGGAEMLEADDLVADRVHELGRMIRAQTARMTAIVRHLLDFGRRGGGDRSAVELGKVARGVAELLASTARRHRCTIDVHADAPVTARANAGEIEQVVSNLVLNAVQATPGGGAVVLRVGVEKRKGGRRAAVTVEDHGTGIAPDDLPRIFDPFFTTKGVGQGTGLGLSVSYGIVRDHGGTIEVASAIGQGTRMTVLLPMDGDDSSSGT